MIDPRPSRSTQIEILALKRDLADIKDHRKQLVEGMQALEIRLETITEERDALRARLDATTAQMDGTRDTQIRMYRNKISTLGEKVTLLSRQLDAAQGIPGAIPMGTSQSGSVGPPMGSKWNMVPGNAVIGVPVLKKNYMTIHIPKNNYPPALDIVGFPEVFFCRYVVATSQPAAAVSGYIENGRVAISFYCACNNATNLYGSVNIPGLTALWYASHFAPPESNTDIPYFFWKIEALGLATVLIQLLTHYNRFVLAPVKSHIAAGFLSVLKQALYNAQLQFFIATNVAEDRHKLQYPDPPPLEEYLKVEPTLQVTAYCGLERPHGRETIRIPGSLVDHVGQREPLIIGAPADPPDGQPSGGKKKRTR
nr:hypothetical protein [Salmonid herpesvirus 1]